MILKLQIWTWRSLSFHPRGFFLNSGQYQSITINQQMARINQTSSTYMLLGQLACWTYPVPRYLNKKGPVLHGHIKGNQACLALCRGSPFYLPLPRPVMCYECHSHLYKQNTPVHLLSWFLRNLYHDVFYKGLENFKSKDNEETMPNEYWKVWNNW